MVFYDPATGQRIATLEDERARADAAEAERDAEREARTAAEARSDAEQTRADAAEARVRELEELLRRQNP